MAEAPRHSLTCPSVPGQPCIGPSTFTTTLLRRVYYYVYYLLEKEGAAAAAAQQHCIDNTLQTPSWLYCSPTHSRFRLFPCRKLNKGASFYTLNCTPLGTYPTPLLIPWPLLSLLSVPLVFNHFWLPILDFYEVAGWVIVKTD